jgi:hypothetical protein
MAMTTSGTPGSLPVDRQILRSCTSYEEAQQVVDRLSDRGFQVETLSIVGADLRLVERVTGRLTTGKAAVAGALSGGWFGLFFGLFIGLFADSGTAFIALVLYGLLLGAAFGAIFGWAAHRSTGGRRDFSSTAALAATRYDVLVEPAHAAEAERLLAAERGS